MNCLIGMLKKKVDEINRFKKYAKNDLQHERIKSVLTFLELEPQLFKFKI
jgi:hypothetical protein